eukprot:jgi/Psemu1/41746/gm1.41746_g
MFPIFDGPNQGSHRIHPTKLIVLAVLGLCALVLGSFILTFQLLVIHKKKQRGLLGSLNTVPNSTPNKPAQSSSNNKNKNNNKLGGVSGSTASSAPASASNAEQKTKNTIRSSQPTEGYWRQVQSFLRDWKDAAVYPPDPSDHHTYSTDWMVQNSAEYRRRSGSGSGSGKSGGRDSARFYPRMALERAAEAGHPMAQHYLANAHSRGNYDYDYDYDYKYEHKHEHEYQNGSSSAASLVEDLYVFDEWLPTSGENTRQVDKAYLLWYMIQCR